MSLISVITGLFKAGATDKVTSTVSKATNMVDKLFTSDSERQQFHILMESILQSSASPIARTGRGAMMWAIALIVFYQAVVRDFTAMIIGRDLTQLCGQQDDLLNKVMEMLGGVM